MEFSEKLIRKTSSFFLIHGDFDLRLKNYAMKL